MADDEARLQPDRSAAAVETSALSRAFGDLVAVDGLALTVERGVVLGTSRIERGRQEYDDQDAHDAPPSDFGTRPRCRLRRRP
jgi:hypothetical protein